MRQAFPPKVAYYVPVDEIAASPRARVLRTIRHFDWITLGDLFVALDLQREDRQRYTAMVVHLVKRGLIEQRGGRETREYRIAPNVDVSIPAPALDGYISALQGRRAS